MNDVTFYPIIAGGLSAVVLFYGGFSLIDRRATASGAGAYAAACMGDGHSCEVLGSGGGGERMFDESDVSRPAEPRLSIQLEEDGTWSAFRGAILLATGLATATDAWDVIDRAASARPPAAPIRSPVAAERSRRSWQRSA